MTRGFHRLRVGISAAALFIIAALKLTSDWPSNLTFGLCTAAAVLAIVDATSRLGRMAGSHK